MEMAFERGPSRVDPNDRAQLAESPVSARRVVGLFVGDRGRLIVLTLTIVATSVAGLAQPFLVREVIDTALPQRDTTLLIWCVVGMVGVAAVTGLLGVWQTWLATAVGQRVMHRLRVGVFDHLQSLALDFFKRTRGGEVQSRLTNDIAGLQSVITSTATSVASNFTTALATAAAMIALSWQLTLLTALVLPPAIWTTRRVALVRRDLTARRQRALAELQQEVQESMGINGAILNRTLGLTEPRSAEFAATSEELVQLELRSQLAGRWRMATMQIIFAAIPALIYLVAGFPALTPGLTIGTLIAFTTLQVAIFRPIMGLLNIGAQWVSSMALLSRIFGYLDLPVGVPEPADPVAIDPATIRGEVRFTDVRFRYPDGDRDVLAGVSLTIPAGGSLGVVGETGSGKSTLASLLVRLDDPTAGRITVDGIDLRDFAASDRSRFIGVVSQETYLVHDTIRANLLLARPDATDTELAAVLRATRIADVVADLPEGLDTVVGSRGHRFSGGERQRLAIARTLLRNPRILVLDEATSALDNDTEREVQAALDVLAQGRTTLTIAHRLSTVADSDEIIVLDEGRIVERGTEAELRAAGGRYAHLLGGASGPALADDQ
ncbi:MAG TPA: ABC transporter ATP-binding protein [Micropruina sp.]|nr:ABC transporter ATP-binding protein [Micropruina sp.]HMR22898.1 ABC transporter ATP-binding protein [Micropruina sp.]